MKSKRRKIELEDFINDEILSDIKSLGSRISYGKSGTGRYQFESQ